ncbi:uncharacterized protein EMH_0004650 [Eimeria mitis]|uniref:Uncharacterized protein n=1 Tax=Eimeria mitis TaxID=44415 RepID=U6K1T1_9EIME|nr:uncharacterized protein EMH_0004650 [Eimeria mitis]CDJ29733.1 hypothetical protein, conserved [Eimeria mitis]
MGVLRGEKMHADATYFRSVAATEADEDPTFVLNVDEKARPSFSRRRLRSPARLVRRGRRELLWRALLVERLVVVAGLAAAFIILKCAFELGGVKALDGLQRSLAESSDYKLTGACGIESNPELVRNNIGVSEFEPEDVTYGRIHKVFDLLEELQRTCRILSVGRGILLQARIACFYLICSAQELAAVSGMLPDHLVTRRVQLTNSASNLASSILERFPTSAVGDNAFRRVSRLRELNNQLLELPETCTLGTAQCRIRLQHLGLVQLVFLNTSLTLLRGLLQWSEKGTGSSNQAVNEMLTAMTQLRHKRRTQILGDHGLGPWVAQYLRLGGPNHVVERERGRQLLLDNSLTPISVLVAQLKEVYTHILGTTGRRNNPAAVASTPRYHATADARQFALAPPTFGVYLTPTAATSSTDLHPSSASSSASEDDSLSPGRAVGSNVMPAPCHPEFLRMFLHQGPLAPLRGPPGQPLREPSGHRREQQSAHLSTSWYLSNQSTASFEGGIPLSGPLSGTHLAAPFPTVQSAIVRRVKASRGHRTMMDYRAEQQSEAASAGRVFYGVAEGEPRPSGITGRMHRVQAAPNEQKLTELSTEHPATSESLREHMDPVSTSSLLYPDGAPAGVSRTTDAYVSGWPLPDFEGDVARGFRGREHFSEFQGGSGQAEKLQDEGRVQGAGFVFHQKSQTFEQTYTRRPQ